jgi:CHAT domain-containing protein
MRVIAALAALLLAMPGSAVAQDNSPEALRAEAFEAAQWAIASEAADALAQVSARFAHGDDALGRLAEEHETLLTCRDRLERELEQLYVRDEAEARGRRTEVRGDYEATVERLGVVEGELRVRFPAYADLTSPRALSVAETQALLGPDEALLLVLANPEATYVWGLSRDRIEWARADLTRANLAEAVTALRASLTAEAARGAPGIDPSIYAGRPAPAFDQATAHDLYARLVRPVEAVFEGRSTLITVVTGPLASLPMTVLSTSPADGADTGTGPAWLGDRYALASLPSVSSLEALRCHRAPYAARRPAVCPGGPVAATRPPSRSGGVALAAFGAPLLTGAPQDATRGAAAADSVMGDGRLANVDKLRALPWLPGSKAELDALGARYPDALVRTGADATEDAVRRSDAAALAKARFVVFSTHGLMAGSASSEPGLVLTPPAEATEADDGYLSASEAAQLRLNADFVVLSACNTAAADGRAGAEGLSGLARAFFYAGARSILVSHWEVSDAATAALILDTFAELDAGAGTDPAARARALQSAMRKVRANPRWSHPAYWAAFTLVGEPG